MILLLNTMWTDPLVGGVGSFISLTGSWAVFIAILAAALALLLARRVPWPPLVVLVAFGWELQTSPRRPAWADRVRPAHRHVSLAVVGQAPARTSGAGIASIITLMQAGLPLAIDRSIAPGRSAALSTNSPCPPRAATTRS